MNSENLKQFADILTGLSDKLLQASEPARVFVGFDGFIDDIIHIVDVRFTPDSFSRIPTIQAYADRLAKGSGMSTNIELVSQQTKMGGNGPILANALLNQSLRVTYMGALGFPKPEPVFSPLRRCEEVICLTSPASTDALEFLDGKIISSKLTPLNDVTWDKILSLCSVQRLIKIFQECDYYVFSNWSMLLGMNRIWDEFLKTIAPHIMTREKKVFFDLADPEKRTEADLQTAVSHIVNFTKAGFHVTLSMNMKEACEISVSQGCVISDFQTAHPRKLLDFLSEKLGIDCIVIHLTDRACCFHSGEYAEVDGPYCQNPKLTTGAGDNFNAGFLYGLTRNFSATECLYLGCATSGYYVRQASSPGTQELADFLTLWSTNPSLSEWR